MYIVINKVTGKVYGPYQTRSRARNIVDKRDNEYGAYVHHIKQTEETSNANTNQ